MSITTKVGLNVKIDADIKQLGELMLNNMGLDHTTFINMAYRELIRERQLPFSPKVSEYAELEIKIAEKTAHSKIPTVFLDVDEEGNIAYDPEKHADLHEWVVNG